MKITEVKLRILPEAGKVKATGTITLDGVFVVNGVSVVEGVNGLFVAMPSRIGSDKKYYDIAHPIDKEFRKELSEEVLKAFEEEKDFCQVPEMEEEYV